VPVCTWAEARVAGFGETRAQRSRQALQAEACSTRGALCLSFVRAQSPSWLFVWVVAAVSQAQPAATSGDFEGRVITRVEFEPPVESQPLPAAELNRRISVHQGAPLHLADVRASIQDLYSTGRYSDISIDAENDAGGVALRIFTEFNFFISGVNIAGESDPPGKEQIQATTKLELGSLFVQDRMDMAEKNVEDLLRANGFYSARLEAHVDRTPATEEANIYFFIHTGQRARFDGVQFSGELNRPEADLVSATEWRRHLFFLTMPGWRELTESRLQSGIRRAQQKLEKGDHLRARVTLDQLQYHPGTDRVTPLLRVDLGPVFEVKVTGAKVSAGTLRRLIPVYQEAAADESLLTEGQRNLLEHFQSLGYYDAKVSFERSELAPDHTVIDYTVIRGPRYELVHIGIAGNRYFDTKTLRERLSITPVSLVRYHRGRFSPALLNRDKSALEDLYRANGFRDVEITVPPPVENYQARPGRLAVNFEIKEGIQWFVNRLDLDGVPESDLPHLGPMLQSIEGEPFSEANVGADREAILSYYFNNGYPDATFDWTQAPAPAIGNGPAPATVDLKYIVRPGKREDVRRVLVRGLNTTRPSVVASRILVDPGDPLSQSAIVTSQQKLYELGIFSTVETAIQDPNGDEDAKYLLFHVDEARKYAFNAGVGAELARIGGGVTTFDAPQGTTSFVPRVSAGISRLNFLGLGHTVSLQTLASTLEQRALLTYTDPQLLGYERLTLTLSGLFDNSKDVRTFESRRAEGTIQISQRLSKANTVQYRYTFRHVTIVNGTLKISSELIPLLSQPDRAGIASVSFIQDRRDNPIETHQGFLNSADVGYAWSGFGSETDFSRLVLRNATYHRIGRDLVLARNLQFGYIQRVAGRVAGFTDFPLAERFYSGGPTTQRAFPENQAGPRDPVTGFPIGGNAFLFHNTELRFPLIGDNVQGVLFWDVGNVYSELQRISFRFWQRNDQDFNYAVNGLGFGIRYRTPLGPIRADFSLSPDSPRFVGFSGTLDQLLAGTGTPNVPQQISVFQFHLSLGQTF
jgi:outer membrane protein insertion porin family